MWYNSVIIAILKSPFNWLVSNQMLLLTYTGRKSGAQYETPISYVELDDGSGEHLLLTISTRKRTWWRNLRGGADVTLRLRGKVRHARAEAFTDEAAVPDLTRYVKGSPDVAKSLGVGFDANKQPIPDDVQKLSENWLIVRFTLPV